VPSVAATPDRPALVPLPGGIWLDRAQPVREIPLRAVGGRDEAFLLDVAALGPMERVNALLARCLATDPDGPPAADLVSGLTVGDREALLLHLRRLTLGDRLDCVITCPAPECREPMELSLTVSELLVAPDPEPRREHVVRLETGGEQLDVRFRLPTTADLAAVVDVSHADPELGASVLLERCVIDAGRGGRSFPVSSLDARDRAAVAGAMAERDPQAVLELDLVCPTCGRDVSLLFDAGEFLLQELDVRATRLIEDVHALALHYHWSERDILALPAERRERYLELLATSLRERAAAGYAVP